MKIIILSVLILFIATNLSIAQKSWLGIPLFDKNIRLSACPICKGIGSDKSLENFND